MPEAALQIGDYDRDADLIAAVRAGAGPRLRVERFPYTCIVLGRGSKPEVELHLDAVLADGVPVLRRLGGGCAVLLDPGNIVVSVVLPLPGLGGFQTMYQRVTQWLIDALAEAGQPGIMRQGVSDLTLGDRKVGGSCVYRARDLFYFSSTLLVSPDIARMERYLAHPPREPEYRRGRDHRQFLSAIDIACDRLNARLMPRLAALADA